MSLAVLQLDYTLRVVALGSAIVGALAGMLGVFALLRRQSLLGDAVSHAALPGVVLAFLITGSKSPITLLLGALAAGLAGAIASAVITSTTKLKSDAALGIVLATYFGGGLVLLTLAQQQPRAAQAGLTRFLFGNASTLLASDVWMLAVLSSAVLIVLLVLWKEFGLLSFDAEYLSALSLPRRGLELMLTGLTVAAICAGLQAVGVVLMSALLVAPAAAARQWTERLGTCVLLSALIGAACGVGGTFLSSAERQLPTGPTIVLLASAAVLVSVLFAPARGVLWEKLRHRSQRAETALLRLLEGMYALAESHTATGKPHDLAALRAVGIQTRPALLHELAERGWAAETRMDGARLWALTPQGVQEARRRLGETA
jgi:manganese/zinc/iron transport system permease protein